ncbi:MAG: hypothetical protein RMJ84_04000 [Sandaracinaceae bacterium]|nr:hypothetical protein [Sandaracinaceae bacterium]
MGLFVAGAGYLGLAVAKEFARTSEAPIWLARRCTQSIDWSSLPPTVHPWPCDLLDPHLKLPPGPLSVVFAAGPAQQSLEAYEQVYVKALANLLDTIDKRGHRLERLILVSSTSVFEDIDGVVDESSPTRDDPKTRILLRAEALSREAKGIVFRLAGIYGPGRTRLIDLVLSGKARCHPSRPFGNRIHRDDAARAIVHLLRHRAPPPLVIGVDHAPVELCEVYRWIAKELGLPPPPMSNEADERTKESLRMGARKRCSNALLLSTGYRFVYPTYREGYGALLKSQRQEIS